MRLEVIARQPGAPTKHPPLLFVHGAWHAAWCWDTYFLPYFAEHGFAASALSLRGHGGNEGAPRVRGKRIAHYVADVAEVAATLPALPILIGHSMGGLVVQKYLEQHDVPAAVLLASVPVHGVINTTLRVIRRHPGPFLWANLTTRLYPIIATPDRARDLLFSPDMPDEDVKKYAQQLDDESYLAYLEMMMFALPRPKRIAARHVPMLVLGATRDRLFAPREIEATARAYGTKAVIFDSAHDMMLESGWQYVADAIITWLRGQGFGVAQS
jgi:pimeloyl-ACP methyl ester carboxylesterase